MLRATVVSMELPSWQSLNEISPRSNNLWTCLVKPSNTQQSVREWRYPLCPPQYPWTEGWWRETRGTGPPREPCAKECWECAGQTTSAVPEPVLHRQTRIEHTQAVFLACRSADEKSACKEKHKKRPTATWLLSQLTKMLLLSVFSRLHTLYQASFSLWHEHGNRGCVK